MVLDYKNLNQVLSRELIKITQIRRAYLIIKHRDLAIDAYIMLKLVAVDIKNS
ncbi:hypothetical protein CREGCYN_05980 [Synechococcus sp. M16CYN]